MFVSPEPTKNPENTPGAIDTSACDRELIHLSEAIQPHGLLLVVDPASFTILRVSENCADIFGLPNAALIGHPLSRALGDADARALQHRVPHEAVNDGPCHMQRCSAGGTDYNLFVHRSGGELILELEQIPPTEATLIDLTSELRATVTRLQATQTLKGFFDLAVQQVRAFTGFGRVMAYKFDQDGCGHVIAESRSPGMEPYLDLHFPASDVPAPAKRMFALSWLRHMPDIDYAPVRLLPEAPACPTDLSHSFLRSVSAMYREYLRNMGVQAVIVLPLMKEGQLWGLIACHHPVRRHVGYEARMATEFLAHMLSLLMASKEDAESQADRIRMKAILDGVMRAMDEWSDLHAWLMGCNRHVGIDRFFDTTGAALVTEQQITRRGITPGEAELRALATWLATLPDPVLATDRLAELYPPAASMAAAAAGLLAIRLSPRRAEFAMWFRPEHATTVNWAGDPHKPVQPDERDGTLRLRPRTSFALWKESVAGRSRPWAEFEIKAAADLRWAVVEMILARTEETERLKQELAEEVATRAVAAEAERLALAAEVSERRLVEGRLLFAAFHDDLTLLRNRAFFMERLATLFGAPGHEDTRPDRRLLQQRCSILFLDLDRFKLINDSLGHGAGDRLLSEVARRLRECVRPEDTLARVGGDEFAILVEGPDCVEASVSVAERIIGALGRPVLLDNNEVFTSCSVGIAHSSGHHTKPEELLRDADLAMYDAKKRGSDRHAVFDPSMHDRAVETLELQTDLRHALSRDELRLVYQPIYDAAGCDVVALEALVRWQHPVRGPIAPEAFIPMAEDIGLIRDIGRWVLRTACLQMDAWAAEQPGVQIRLSVNVSGEELRDNSFIGDLQEVLQTTGFDASRLQLEITESVFLRQPEIIHRILSDIRTLGVRIALDDFGTGYSSLGYLDRYQFDTLKIDRSFVGRMLGQERAVAIMEGILRLGSALKLDIVAEGVETEAQLAKLRSLGSCQLQGYLLGRPMAMDTISAVFGAQRSRVQAGFHTV